MFLFFNITQIFRLGISHSLKAEPTRRKNQNNQHNIAFLEILIEFSPKLLRQDKQAVLKYLEKNCPVTEDVLANEESWTPYLLYRASLQEKHTAPGDDVASVRSFAQATRGRRGGRRKTTPTPSEISAA